MKIDTNGSVTEVQFVNETSNYKDFKIEQDDISENIDKNDFLKMIHALRNNYDKVFEQLDSLEFVIESPCIANCINQ